MDHDTFLKIVADGAGVDREGAERAVQATLETLGERIDREEARQVAAQLPPEIAPFIATTGAAEAFDVEEFLRRIAEREGADAETAERHARIVLGALAQAVSGDELADVIAELPRDFARVLPRGPQIDVMPAGTFVERVAEHAGLDTEGARRATDAVLETLAERIAGGEVEDLIDRLDPELQGPLDRGRTRTGGQPMRMTLDGFLKRVAEREASNPLVVREHVRAVLVTLREAVGDDEFFDVTVQLPSDYRSMLVAG